MASQISLESFKRLLEDDVFVDYLNKFCSLPVFGQRIVYRKKLSKCICEPDFAKEPTQSDVLVWIWETRLPFFFRSHIYAEYKLAKALIDYDLNEDGGVEPALAKAMEDLQYHSFSKMSRFSKFCQFLSETGEGLKLAAFFIAAQHVFVAYYEGDPDTAVHIGELRDKFFDETSYWCLPKKVLENFARCDQSTSVAFCMTVSGRVLSRICLYWLPRYLLHLRLRSMNDQSSYPAEEARRYLHDLVFRVQDMDPETARKSVSMRGLTLLSDMNKRMSNLQDISDKNNDDKNVKPDESLTDLFPVSNKLDVRGRERRMVSNVGLARTGSVVGQKSSHTKSIAIPGCEIKVERKKSKRPTMLQLSTAIEFGTSIMKKGLGNDRTTQAGERTVKSERLEQIRQTRRLNKDSVLTGRLQDNQMTKSTMRKASGLRNVQSVSGLADRITSVTKAISKFKLARDTQQPATQPSSSKTTKPAPAEDLSKNPVKVKRPRIIKDDQGPIKEQMKNVIKFKAADLLDKFGPEAEKNESERRSTEQRTSGVSKSSVDIRVSEKKSQPSLKPQAPKPSFATVVSARNIAMKWKKGGFVKPAKGISPKTSAEKISDPSSSKPSNIGAPKKMTSMKQLVNVLKNKQLEKESKKEEDKGSGLKNEKGLKMVFAMSDQKEDQKDDQKTIKVLSKKNNRVTEDVVDLDEKKSDDELEVEPIPNAYLRNRRNAMSKIKPLKTLRKRPHSQLPTAAAAKQETKRTVKKQTKNSDNRRLSKVDSAVTPHEKQFRLNKANFIQKALMVGTLQERIKAPEREDDDSMAEFGDSYSRSVYSVHEDQVYRHEMRHLRAALRSDDFAAGPFMTYLTEVQNDEAGMFALAFWQEVERFREEFSGMQQSDLVLTMDQIFTKYVLNDRGFQFIPGMKEYSGQIIDIDIFSCLTFPWPLRLLQRNCMEQLNTHWEDYMINDTTSFYDAINLLSDVEEQITVPAVIQLIKSAFEEEVPPVPTEQDQPKNEDKSELKREISNAGRKSAKKKDASKSNVTISTTRPTAIGRTAALLQEVPRSTLGYLPGQMEGKTRQSLQAVAMARRAHRAYLLAEQTCRLTAKMPQTDKFVSDESDDEGFIKPKPPPIYLRAPKIDMKTLSLLSAKEYPSKNPLVRRTAIVRNTEKSKAPSYMKDTIRKNGVILKRPTMRPKHLVDCLRDPVHLEFFRRFAKTYHFERSVRFWKAIEVMKHIDDPKIRQAKIRGTVNQFFAKGAATGVGVDGQVLRDIMRTPPEKVTVSMLISAQACVMKALEDVWGERYLSTFTDVKKNPAGQKDRMDRTEIMKMAQSNGKMTSIWRVFYAFIKRSAKFISTMKNRDLRHEFELYLQTVGRDPTVYQKEGWAEINAISYDVHMNSDVVFHQKKQQGRHVIAELLINDFRFWCEVECYRSQAEHIQQNGDNGMYDAVDEAILHDKAKLICDQFLSSPIPPKCRINIQSELSSTVIENVKLGMFNRSLFHDLTINIFPLLLNYWKIFCERRHKYVPRSDLNRFKHELVLQRRSVKRGEKPKPTEIPIEISGDGPLVDYCSSKRFSSSWMDISKTMEDQACMNFSLAAGVKLSVPLKQPAKTAIPRINSGESGLSNRPKASRK